MSVIASDSGTYQVVINTRAKPSHGLNPSKSTSTRHSATMSKSKRQRPRPGVSSTTSTEEALPPPVDHRRYAGVREAKGLPVSCVHNGAALFDEEELWEALLQRICGHYEAAFKLLPVAVQPDLIASLEPSVVRCLGLLEPRSNIVVNAVIDHHRRHRRCNVVAGVDQQDDAVEDHRPPRGTSHGELRPRPEPRGQGTHTVAPAAAAACSWPR